MQAKLLLIEAPGGQVSAVGGFRRTQSARRLERAIAPIASEYARPLTELAEGWERIDSLAGAPT